MTATLRATKAAQTRQLIEDTAQRLFTDLGYDGTSLQMIADEMGVTKAAVYYHFRTKAEILHAIAAGPIGDFHALLDQVADKTSRRERIAALVEGFVDLIAARRDMAAVKNSDPAIHREIELSGAFASLEQRGLQVTFGDQPSADEVTAYRLLLCVPEVIPRLNHLSDEELRETLSRTCLRLLRIRS